MLKDGYIDEKTKQYLIQSNVKLGRRFYILPKIHKTGNPGRPSQLANEAKTSFMLTVNEIIHI